VVTAASATEGDDLLPIIPGVSIPTEEFSFTFARSSGPGGQNVNKVNTRVTLHFDVAATPSLTARQKAVIRSKLATRVSRDGVLRVVASRHRTQKANRRATIERFQELLAEALRAPKPRKKTKVPAAVKRKRLEDKARRARTKELRRAPRET